MKGLNVLAAFLGGAAVGAALGILFAPEKGEDTRHKIAEILRKKGIKLNRSEMENLVHEIPADKKGEIAESVSNKRLQTEQLCLGMIKVLRIFNNYFSSSRSIWNFKKNMPN